MIFPAATLLIFLSVAAFHFGKEDTQFLINKKSYIIQLLYLLKGLLIILAPLFFHFDDTVKIFKSLLVVNESFYLFLEFLEEKKIIEIAIILSSLSSIFLFIDKFELKKSEEILRDNLVENFVEDIINSASNLIENPMINDN